MVGANVVELNVQETYLFMFEQQGQKIPFSSFSLNYLEDFPFFMPVYTFLTLLEL